MTGLKNSFAMDCSWLNHFQINKDSLIDFVSPFHQFFIRYVIIILRLSINHSFWPDFYDPVTDSLYKCMVMRRHQDISLKFYQSVVKCLD